MSLPKSIHDRLSHDSYFHEKLLNCINNAAIHHPLRSAEYYSVTLQNCLPIEIQSLKLTSEQLLELCVSVRAIDQKKSGDVNPEGEKTLKLMRLEVTLENELNDDYWIIRGVNSFSEQNYHHAMRCSERALELNHNDVNALHLSAVSLAKIGEPNSNYFILSKAKDRFLKALSLQTDQDETIENNYAAFLTTYNDQQQPDFPLLINKPNKKSSKELLRLLQNHPATKGSIYPNDHFAEILYSFSEEIAIGKDAVAIGEIVSSDTNAFCVTSTHFSAYIGQECYEYDGFLIGINSGLLSFLNRFLQVVASSVVLADYPKDAFFDPGTPLTNSEVKDYIADLLEETMDGIERVPQPDEIYDIKVDKFRSEFMMSLNEYAVAFIILHELSHIRLGQLDKLKNLSVLSTDSRKELKTEDLINHEHEFNADRLAFDLLIRRIQGLDDFEIQVAICSVEIVFFIFHMRELHASLLPSQTHPHSLDRINHLRNSISFAGNYYTFADALQNLCEGFITDEDVDKKYKLKKMSAHWNQGVWLLKNGLLVDASKELRKVLELDCQLARENFNLIGPFSVYSNASTDTDSNKKKEIADGIENILREVASIRENHVHILIDLPNGIITNSRQLFVTSNVKISNEIARQFTSWIKDANTNPLNSAVYAIHEILDSHNIDVPLTSLSVALVTVDIVSDIIKPYDDVGLKSSLFAIRKIIESYRLNYKAVKITPVNDVLNIEKPIIINLNSEKFVVLKKVDANYVYYKDCGHTKRLDQRDFLSELSGFILAPITKKGIQPFDYVPESMCAFIWG